MLKKGEYAGAIKGFPNTVGSWCKKLKYENRAVDIRRYILSYPNAKKRHGLQNIRISHEDGAMVQFNTQNGGATQSEIDIFSKSPNTTGAINIVQFLGIAADERERIKRHTKNGVRLPLVDAGWDEAYCRKWCEKNDLLSPIYTDSARGGCWFCHNQGVGQLRLLRKNYPDLWSLLMKWDLDSPVTFHSDGHTVHDFDKRFEMEDKGIISANLPFRWDYITTPPKFVQTDLFDALKVF